MVGPGWVGLRSHPRPSASITFGGPAVPGWLDDTLRDDRRRRRPRGRPDDRDPARVVDAHVHLWDPARTDWYPYLSGRQQLDMGDVTGMARRFDVPTYLEESAGWNVEKLVNVAAATGRPLHRRDARARRPCRDRGPPRRHHRGPASHRVRGRGRGAPRPADGRLPLPGHPTHGRLRRAAAGRRRARRARGAGPGVRADGPPRPAPGRRDGAGRLRRAGRRRRAHRVAALGLRRGARPVEGRHRRAGRARATTSCASCRGWPCRSGR